MHARLKQRALELRMKDSLSYGAIREKLGVSKSTLSEWLKEYPLSKTRILELKRAGWKKSETKIELFRAAMREKKEKRDQEAYLRYKERFQNLSQDSFFIAGLMLYLAEGSKVNRAVISLANTDPRVCKLFIMWLEKFFDLPRKKLKAHLQLYEDMDVDSEVGFWMKELEFTRKQFYKPFVRKLTPSSFSYSGSFRHGTCSVKLGSSELQREIMMAIKAYLDSVI